MTTHLNDKNDNNEDRFLGTAPQAQRAPVHVLWYVAIGVALVAIVGLFIGAHQLATQVARLNDSTQAQIARLSDQVAQSGTESAKQAELVAQEAHDIAASVEEKSRSEMRKSAATLSAKLAEQGQTERQTQQQVAGELENLKAAGTDASSKLNAISGDVSSVKGDVASTQAEVEKTGSELKRMTGDMGVMSGLIATNAGQLSALKDLGERNYQEFDIKRTGGLQKIGAIQLALSKADPKRNRFTLDVLTTRKCRREIEPSTSRCSSTWPATASRLRSW